NDLCVPMIVPRLPDRRTGIATLSNTPPSRWTPLRGPHSLMEALFLAQSVLHKVSFRLNSAEERHRNSISPAEREKYRPRSSPEPEHKKLKKEEKDCHASDGEKSDQDLVVDDASESIQDRHV
ncbi:hypothetical protein L9F63_007090, partial [Diploptera punctata]